MSEQIDIIGKQFGNYVITDLIGEGGMGAVYRAKHPEIGRNVAIKVLDPRLGDSPEICRRFLTEARALARIEHLNVIDIYDFGRSIDGQLYYVMELLRGATLGTIMEERGAFPARDIWPYLEQICDGLQAAHEHDITHRDLKPENIFILDSKRLTIKIIDFGIAKIHDPEFKGPAKTAKGVVMGTPLTISPEQAAGLHEKVGAGTDLYALGVVLYWMLSGQPPFTDNVPAVILAKHVRDAPTPLGDVVEDLPPALVDLVHGCLAKEPDDRPGSAAEIADRFKEAVPGLEQANVTLLGHMAARPGDDPVIEAPGDRAAPSLPDMEPARAGSAGFELPSPGPLSSRSPGGRSPPSDFVDSPAPDSLPEPDASGHDEPEDSDGFDEPEESVSDLLSAMAGDVVHPDDDDDDVFERGVIDAEEDAPASLLTVAPERKGSPAPDHRARGREPTETAQIDRGFGAAEDRGFGAPDDAPDDRGFDADGDRGFGSDGPGAPATRQDEGFDADGDRGFGAVEGAAVDDDGFGAACDGTAMDEDGFGAAEDRGFVATAAGGGFDADGDRGFGAVGDDGVDGGDDGRFGAPEDDGFEGDPSVRDYADGFGAPPAGPGSALDPASSASVSDPVDPLDTEAAPPVFIEPGDAGRADQAEVSAAQEYMPDEIVTPARKLWSRMTMIGGAAAVLLAIAGVIIGMFALSADPDAPGDEAVKEDRPGEFKALTRLPGGPGVDDLKSSLSKTLSLDPSKLSPESTGKLVAAASGEAGTARARVEAGRLLLAWGKPRQAAALIRRALSDSEGDHEARLLLGEAIHSAGEPGNAISHYKAVLATRKTHASARFRLGEAQLEVAQYKAALASFQAARDSSSGLTPHVLHRTGDVHAARGETSQAQGQYLAALAADERYAPARVSLGSTYAKLGRFDKALELLDQAIQQLPNDPMAHYYRGTVLYNLDRADEAVQAYRSALKNNPAFVEAHYYLGQTYLKRGEKAQAKKQFQAAINIKPDFEPAVLALSKL